MWAAYWWFTWVCVNLVIALNVILIFSLLTLYVKDLIKEKVDFICRTPKKPSEDMSLLNCSAQVSTPTLSMSEIQSMG